ncbi:hypothetical protein HON01_02410 [Candidatus Woesearchaeota archaeon]|nr:hypothetical protein [Candidatus Woesearchaeota archaeon]
METKIKNRTDDQGKPNPRGETQVRELGDVLSKPKPVHYIDEFEKQIDKFGYQEFIQIKELKQDLEDQLLQKDYNKSSLDGSASMYVRINKDKSVDVLVEQELNLIKVGQIEKGFTYLQLKDHKELNEFEFAYRQVYDLKKISRGAKWLTKGLMTGAVCGGVIGGLILLGGGGTTGFMISLASGTGLIGGLIGGLGYDEEYTIRNWIKIVESYQDRMIVGKEAMKKAIYK